MKRLLFQQNKIKENIENTSVKKFKVSDKIKLSKVMQLNMAINL